MPELELHQFEQYLLRAGVARRFATRASLEIRDHFDDLVCDARADGMTESQAKDCAADRLGYLRDIADAMLCRPELRVWTQRYPKLARICLPVAYIALLPTTPLFAGVARAQDLARWGVCMMLGAAITAVMLLVMQFSIAFG